MTEEQLTRRREREFLLSFLKRGGALVREDIGGAIGVRWGRAHRCGPAFDPLACERLLERGCTIDGQPRVLAPPRHGPANVYTLQEARP